MNPRRIIATVLLAIGLSGHSATAQQAGLTAETWTGLTPGKSILILRKEGISTRAPNTTQTVTSATVTGRPANSGTRLRGTLTPPVNDTYTFWVNGADNVALWLSEDGTRFTKRLIAWHLGTTTTSEWSKHANQKSIPIALSAGVTYHIEAHVMSSTANGHVSIAWQGRDGNWALAANGAIATQSSTQWGLGADKAIDGKITGTWSDATMTTNQQNSWLKVDFAQIRSLNEVVLLNSPSNQNRLSNFRISALDASGAVLSSGDFFTTSGNVGNSFTWTLPNTVDAKSVKIQLLGNNLAGNGHLSLLEVQAYGPGPLSLTRNFQVIPGTYLTPIAADPADLDDNHLADTWQTQTGLDASSLPGALLEFGDPDQDGIANYEEQVLGSDPLTKESFGDVITRSMWMDLSGSGSEGVVSMTNFANRNRYLGIPNDVSLVAGIDANLSYLNYGARYRGSFVAPTTGSYRFWLAASGAGELWLSDGTVKDPSNNQALTNRFGKQLLATSGHVTPQRDFDFNASQRSRSVTLVEGQTYYIEALHKVAQGSLDHVSVAWKPPGQSRSIMPATVFRANAPDSADADDDGLPDAWETAVGLNPANNGQNNTVDGEYADPDVDGLSNLFEYQSGTNPLSADSDGDGISDYDEIKLYGSDPLVSNNLAPVTITLPALNQYSSATGSWTANSNGTISALERRGAITYTFTVTAPGVHEVVVAAGAISPTPWYAKTLNLVLSLDGDSPFAAGTINSHNGNAGTIRAVTPWLSAGTHTITILHDNVLAELRLRLDSVSISRLAGTDLDEDGIPDWIKQNEAAANVLTRIPSQSRTSPVSIEGVTRQYSSTALTALMPGATAGASIPVSESVNNSFFADVPLAPAGAVTLNASFLGGVVTESHSISWVPTNLFEFDQSELHIRKGDALRLDAWSGTAPDNQPFEVLHDQPVTFFNQSNPPDVNALGTGAGSYRGFSVRFDDTSLDCDTVIPSGGPRPLRKLAIRRSGTQGSATGTPASAILKIYTSKTPSPATWVADSTNTADIRGGISEANVIFNFDSVLLDPNVQYWFHFANTTGNLPLNQITWTSARLRLSNNAGHTFPSGNLVNASWGDQDTGSDPLIAATFGYATLLSDENQNTTHVSGNPFAATFAQPGIHTLTATWHPATGPAQTASVSVVVHSADFGPAHLVRAGTPRPWAIASLDDTTIVEADDRFVFTETTTMPQTGPRTFNVSIGHAGARHVIARIPETLEGAPASILARGTVQGFQTAQVEETRDAQIVHRYDDGTWLMHNTIVAVNLPPGVVIRITSLSQGTTFAQGGTVLELRAQDFDANGIAHIYYEYSGIDNPKICHKVEILINP